MRGLFLVPLVFMVAMAFAWVSNVVKLTNCDFVAPYKCEVIHGIGIIPPVALITSWFASDKAP